MAVDVGGFEVKGFVEPEAALVDGGEERAVSTVAEGGQQAGDLFTSENVWERFLAFDFDLGPDLPAMVEVIAVESAQGTDGLVDSGAGEVALGLEVEEEVEDLGAL